MADTDPGFTSNPKRPSSFGAWLMAVTLALGGFVLRLTVEPSHPSPNPDQESIISNTSTTRGTTRNLLSNRSRLRRASGRLRRLATAVPQFVENGLAAPHCATVSSEG